MKRTRSAIFAFTLPFAVVGSFVFGRYVSSCAYMPLRDAHMLASTQESHGLWQEAQNDVGTHDLAVPVSFSPNQKIAQNDSDTDIGSDLNSELFSSTGPAVTFQQVFALLKQNYVDKIDSDAPLAHGAVSAMIASLDEPNSRFLEPDARAAVEEQSKGVFDGAGIVFSVRKKTVDGLLERQLTVVDAVPGSPAQKAGIQTGDIITDINGHWIISYDPFAAQAKLFKSLDNDPVSFNHVVDATDAKIKDGYDLGKAQTLLDATSTVPLLLSITRNTANLKVSVDTSVPTAVTDVSSKVLADGNGYIQINAFTDTTAADFEKAITAVLSTPGIVIDLRSCPGGSLDPALAMARALDPNAALGSVAVRDNSGVLDKDAGFKVRTEQLTSDAVVSPGLSPISYSGHLVVLVDPGTANVAELFAAYLHDNLGAHIVGDTTFGDGMVQTLFPMDDGSAFTLTTGIVKTSANYEFEAKGITPDVALAQDDTDSPDGLTRAEALLSLKPLATASEISASPQQKS